MLVWWEGLRSESCRRRAVFSNDGLFLFFSLPFPETYPPQLEENSFTTIFHLSISFRWCHQSTWPAAGCSSSSLYFWSFASLLLGLCDRSMGRSAQPRVLLPTSWSLQVTGAHRPSPSSIHCSGPLHSGPNSLVRKERLLGTKELVIRKFLMESFTSHTSIEFWLLFQTCNSSEESAIIIWPHLVRIYPCIVFVDEVNQGQGQGCGPQWNEGTLVPHSHCMAWLNFTRLYDNDINQKR